MTQVQTAVGIVVGDTQALIHNLRFAFANHDTVVQELLQNARRAGASAVHVTYDAAALTLTVEDNGAGIEDFSVLLSITTSGWDQATKEQERPYGMGFLSAVYAAQEVRIESRGKVLQFNTEQALAGEKFFVQPDTQALVGRTRVILNGFKWNLGEQTVPSMVDGFAIPVFFNGQEMPRPHAVTSDAFKGEHGSYIFRGNSAPSGALKVFLQGFCVYKSRLLFSADETTADVVHLDNMKYVGKLPDRNCIIDEELMMNAVRQETKAFYEARLIEMKRTLPALEFCEQGYMLAAYVDRLDVFNDIDVLPASWLVAFNGMPYSCAEGDQMYCSLKHSGHEEHRNLLSVSRAEVASGCVALAARQWLESVSNETGEAWMGLKVAMLAYACKALVLDNALDEKHWVHELIQLTDTSDVSLDIEGPGAGVHVPRRCDGLPSSIQIQLCDAVQLTCGDVSARVTEAFFALVGEKKLLLVPKDSGGHAWVDDRTLRQYGAYLDDNENVDWDCVNRDVRIVNDEIRALLAGSPEEALATLLRSALAEYQEVRGKDVRVQVDVQGRLTVASLADLPAAIRGDGRRLGR